MRGLAITEPVLLEDQASRQLSMPIYQVTVTLCRYCAASVETTLQWPEGLAAIRLVDNRLCIMIAQNVKTDSRDQRNWCRDRSGKEGYYQDDSNH